MGDIVQHRFRTLCSPPGGVSVAEFQTYLSTAKRVNIGRIYAGALSKSSWSDDWSQVQGQLERWITHEDYKETLINLNKIFDDRSSPPCYVAFCGILSTLLVVPHLCYCCELAQEKNDLCEHLQQAMNKLNEAGPLQWSLHVINGHGWSSAIPFGQTIELVVTPPPSGKDDAPAEMKTPQSFGADAPAQQAM